MEVDTETGAVKMRKYVCLRRHRQHHQPADRRRAGARRPGAGHRAGALGGGRVRRRRHPGHRLVRRLPAAHRGRHDQLRASTTRPRRRTTNTLGTKGVGEAGTIASTPAVVNAVVDAIRHLGVNDIQMPCTPERVWKAIQGGGSGGSHRGRGDAALRGRRHRGQPGQPGTAARKEQAHDPRTVRLRRPDLRRGRAGGPRPARRRRQDPGRRPEPAAGAADAAQRPRDDHRPRQDRVAARRPRRRRRARDRRHDPALRRWARPAGRRARRADHQGGRAPGRRPDPAPRHLRRGARARRPGRRPRRPGAGARRGVRDRRAPAAPARSRPPTSSSTSSRPRSATTRSSPRCGSRSTPAGARTTRSSCGSPTSGRSSRSRPTVQVEGGTIGEARVGLDQHGLNPVRATGGRAGAGRAAGHRGRRTRRRGAGRGGHQPAVRPQRRRRLPPAPRDGAHPPRGAGGRGRA